MTMEELVIAVRVTADNAGAELDAISGGLREIGRAGDAGLQAVQQQMTRLRSQLGLTGSAVSDVVREVQAAAQKAQQIGEDAYQAVNTWIAHRRHMGEMTAQEEIAALAYVRDAYAATAAQIMQMDERIYDARASLRASEADKLTTLHASLVDALSAQYGEQRALEQESIAASIAQWQAWSDEATAAVQRQIDALDSQAQAEQRAAQEAEHLRTIEGLEQTLAYEHDAYNRSQLERQLELAKAAWAQTQQGWQQEDRRDALRGQMESIARQAEEEIAQLQAESSRIDAVYDELLKGQSLAAQAQKLLMESSQEELLSLLCAYAPDYEATGRTLGEKLYEGFQAAFGDVSAWFSQVDAQFEQMAEAAQAAAYGASQRMVSSGAASAVTGGPVISQTVNFNQPVESAADVTRRMQQVSEELAGML